VGWVCCWFSTTTKLYTPLSSEKLFSGYSGFPLSWLKPTFRNSNSIWIVVKHFIMSPCGLEWLRIVKKTLKGSWDAYRSVTEQNHNITHFNRHFYRLLLIWIKLSADKKISILRRRDLFSFGWRLLVISAGRLLFMASVCTLGMSSFVTE